MKPEKRDEVCVLAAAGMLGSSFDKKGFYAALEKNPDVKPEDIPTDLLTASGSGLDPHISPKAAEIQIPRIVAASGLEEDQVRKIIENHTTSKLLGVFGEETVNVVKVNIELGTAMGLLQN